MPHVITMIAGDGIGPEVAEATQTVLDATGVHIQWDRQLAGLCALEKNGEALPQETIDSVRRTKVALKGPTTTPVGHGHVSANVRLRRELDLYASVRPVKSIPSVPGRYDNVDLVVFRENTEGLYAGLENVVSKDVVLSIKVVTENASHRIALAAFEYARKKGRRAVTALHKANIMKLGDGFFLECVEKVANQYPEIEYQEAIIDSACMHLVQDPTQFDVLVMENLYGDIVSDICAGLVGGLGTVPGANIGEHEAIFEAVHGSAPDIVGQGRANPIALINSAILMLEHIGELSASERLALAVGRTLADPEVRPADLGGTAGTSQITERIVRELEQS